MSAKDPHTQSRITGHTGANGGGIDAHGYGRARAPRMDGGMGSAGAPRWGESSLSQSESEVSRSMGMLLRELSTESGNLVRQEVELAKAELREKVGVLQRSAVTMAIGGGLLLAALLTGLWALNMGLTSLLAQMMDLEIAAWLSPLLLTVALGAVGWSMVAKGKEALAREGLAPRETTATLKEDARWARTKAHEVKEEMIHGR